MPEGSTFIFYIPPGLAYGTEGRGAVRPNSVLIYRIELVKVERSGSER
jgi:FKBP-type peptidyl-prolyl cis-trans isomerase